MIFMDPLTIGALGIVLLLVLLIMGMPIAFALALSGFIGLVAIKGGLGGSLGVLSYNPYGTIASYSLVVVPLFILMGHLAFAGGISEDMYSFGHKWVGGFPGGLAMATVVGCAAFAATSGSSVATAATMGKIAIPQMSKYGYDIRLATGCVAAGGLLGIMIPPSVPLVIYGIATGTSIGRLLIAGLIPGIGDGLVLRYRHRLHS